MSVLIIGLILFLGARRAAPIPAAGPVLNDGIAIVAGLVVYALFVWRLHEWLFGVMPLQ